MYPKSYLKVADLTILGIKQFYHFPISTHNYFGRGAGVMFPFSTHLLYKILDSLRWKKFSFMIVGMTGIEGIGEFDTTRVTPVEKVLRIADRRRRNPPDTKPREESKGKTPVNLSSTKPGIYDSTGRLVKNIG